MCCVPFVENGDHACLNNKTSNSAHRLTESIPPPFTLILQLHDIWHQWLLFGKCVLKGVIVVLVQLLMWLPQEIAEWICCHWSAHQTNTTQLSRDHLVLYLELGFTTSQSLCFVSPSFVASSFILPISTPQSQGPLFPCGTHNFGWRGMAGCTNVSSM